MAEFNIADLLKTVPNLGPTADEKIERISLDLIDSDPRNFYTLSGMDELVANLELVGLQHPIRVRPHPEAEGRYMIVSGHRRRHAWALLGHKDINCIVDRRKYSDEMWELQLIYANSGAREISPAEKLQQVNRTRELLYRMKEQGVEFPGRMRDYVAEAVKVSKTELGRLQLIDKKLNAAAKKLWEAEELNTSVAYELARMDEDRQDLIVRCALAGGTVPYYFTGDYVKRIGEHMNRVAENGKTMTCHIGECVHTPVRMQLAARGDYGCYYCCKQCYKLADCEYSCGQASEDKQRKIAERKEAKATEKAAKKAVEEPKLEMLREVYARVGKLQSEKGLSSVDLLAASGGIGYGRRERFEELTSGKKPKLTDRLPGEIWPDDATHLIGLADALGCSVDYILGREDLPKQAAPAAQSGWKTGDPPKDGCYVLAYRDMCAAALEYDLARYDSHRGWVLYGSNIADVGIVAEAWIEKAEVLA